nr:PREDICTED: uncharacterized protein LOC109043231 isoform X3 [Bemisia tabaci]
MLNVATPHHSTPLSDLAPPMSQLWGLALEGETGGSARRQELDPSRFWTSRVCARGCVVVLWCVHLRHITKMYRGFEGKMHRTREEKEKYLREISLSFSKMFKFAEATLEAASERKETEKEGKKKYCKEKTERKPTVQWPA